jgi:hypothetical protein
MLQQNIKYLLKHLIDIHEMVKEVVASQKKGLSLKERETIIEDRWDTLAAKIKQRKEEDKKTDSLVLEELWFPTITHRHMEIPQAHRRTFDWIFEPAGSGDQTVDKCRPWSNFIEWLEEDGNVYWINGKAGSGKSTLIKYLGSHPQVRECIKTWAGDAKPRVITFYFWNSGSEEQRSQIGLLRSLLYKLLLERRDLIRVVLEEEWNYLSGRPSRSDIRLNWSLAGLERVLKSVLALESVDTKTCFFIDGLDEYEGDTEALVGLFTKISESTSVKVCLSSRPGILFEEAFQDCPGLRLQDLTSEDIRLYVRERLQSNQRMAHLEKSNHIDADFLIQSITAKANGVFLWVRIVTQSLLDGLRNFDDISDLQRRLDVLPSDLDKLYSHMIDRIDPLYHAQGSRIFQIYDAATDIGLKPVILELELAVTASLSAAKSQVKEKMSDLEVQNRCKKMEVHLKTRCEGLLEVHDILDRNWESAEFEGQAEIEQEEWEYVKMIKQRKFKEMQKIPDRTERKKRLKVDCKISYLHRTVKDFLKTDQTRAKLQRFSASLTNFDPILSLLISYIINLKRSLYTFHLASTRYEEERIRQTTRDFLRIATRVKYQDDEFQAMLYELFLLTARWWTKFYISMNCRPLPPSEWRAEFLSMATCFGLWKHVDESLARNQKSSEPVDCTELLRCALGLYIPHRSFKHRFRDSNEQIRLSMVNVLLQHGADPNEDHEHHHSIWQAFLHLVAKLINPWPGNDQGIGYVRILQTLLVHGANPTPCDQHASRTGVWGCAAAAPFTLECVLDKGFSANLPKETAALRVILQQQHSSTIIKRQIEKDEDKCSHKRKRP